MIANILLLVYLTMNAYHITQWRLYERADTRKTLYMSWYAKQTKLIGLGIGRTMREAYPRNMTLLGTWNVIETLACLSALEARGWLVRNGVPLDADGMSSLVPSVPPQAFQEAVDWFSQPMINWLEKAAYSPGHLPPQPASQPADGKSPGESPNNLPDNGNGVGDFPATDRQTDRQGTDRQTVKKETKKPATPEEAKQQSRQFSATKEIVVSLEGLPDDDRTQEQDQELKKMRARLKAIQKKQAGGDFTPVEG